MITSSTKTAFFATVILCMALLACVGGSIYVIHLKERELEEYLDARATRAAAEKESVLLGNLTEDTMLDREELLGYIVTESSVINFLAYIDAIYREQGVEVETSPLAVEAIKDNKNFEYLVLNVSVSGQYAAIKNILSIFESLPYQAQVRSVQIDKVGTNGHANFRLYVTKYKSL